MESRNHFSELLQQAMGKAPRVGTMVLQDGEHFDSLQREFPEKQLRIVELCKGANRYRKAPVKLVKHEAPWRKTLSLHRQSLEPHVSPWVFWESQSNRQITSKAPPSRIMITMFFKDVQGCKRPMSFPTSVESKTARPNDDEGDELDELSRQLGLEDNIPSLQDQKDSNQHSSESPTSMDQLQQSIIKHGPKFQSLPVKDRQWLSKLHHNLGHPNCAKLQAVLKHQQYDEKLIHGLADFRCGTCVMNCRNRRSPDLRLFPSQRILTTV